MRKTLALAGLCFGFVVAPLTQLYAGTVRVGGGAHYYKTVKDIDVDNVDEDGVAWLASIQYKPSDFTGLQFDLEVLPDDYAGSDEQVLAPQAYVTVGSGLYAGLGIGIYYSDGDFADQPFYALRAGLDVSVLPALHLDINANYRFDDWSAIKTVDDDISEDTITLGAALRLEI